MARIFAFMIRLGFASLLLTVFLGIVFFVLAFETDTHLNQLSPISIAQTQDAASFVKRASKKIINSHKPVTVSGTETEINGALLLANRTYSGIIGAVDFDTDLARFSLSLRFRALGRHYYLNSKASLLSSADGIRWTNGRIGKIPLSDAFSDFLFKKFIRSLIGASYGKNILAGVKNVQIENKILTLNFHPPPNFQDGFAEAVQRLSTYSGREFNFDTARVQYYLDFLVTMTRSLPKQNISLSHYVQAIFAEAHAQTHILPLRAEQENLAALFALAIQVAPGTFRHFVSGIKVRRLNATHQPRLTLSGRTDLAKHFIYGAALKILADKGVSFSLGETKEMIDANAGGSGFSFADLAADKAGIRFAEVAIDNDLNAQLLQELCRIGIKEPYFFTYHLDLPEGLSEADFLRLYSNVGSKQYQAMLDEIDRHLGTTLILGITN